MGGGVECVTVNEYGMRPHRYLKFALQRRREWDPGCVSCRILQKRGEFSDITESHLRDECGNVRVYMSALREC